MSSEEVEQLKSWQTGRIYLHYFDVDWSESLHMAVPRGALNGDDPGNDFYGIDITPVVFITNRTFEMQPEADGPLLAGKMARKIKAMNTRSASFFPKEIQIDCDWTASTRKKYFQFLEAFKKQFPGTRVSATIRLYPYRYPEKMGIPPVDKGMLMCYNLGKVSTDGTCNSIFDLKTLSAYLNGKKYPLPLDLAFPAFGWYAWFRDGQFKSIVHQEEQFVADTTLLTTTSPHRYRFQRDTVIDNTYFREGDQLRMEYPDTTELKTAIALMTRRIPDYQFIAFYHWHLPTINKYEKVIQETFDRYR
ncbi:hypothetical protein FHW36_106436 [Chitinophaga polysaccharea]|uniref:Uncharacterized protein n=1 Tax=Chitinophaga polysaccharea TaxID=1293035 RepID=A0A561PM58_9BACT|nr:hypothetical protein [Chitinophaga polysaccharea]TWF39205.1 hypothetical protein FHW36_106436 [Chitinophaga polysaccharea]